MPDDFSKTIQSVSDEYAHVTRSEVRPATGAQGKKVDPKRSAREKYSEGGQGGFQEQYSTLRRPPDTELWNTLIEAVRLFNRHQEIKDSPFAIRIWAQNDGIRVQLIDEESGRLVKQTKIIPFSELTESDINDIINDLIRERGIVIDFTR